MNPASSVLFISAVVPWPPRSGGRIRTLELLRAVQGRARVHLRCVEDPAHTGGTNVEVAPLCASFETFPRTPAGILDRVGLPRVARWFHSAPLGERVAQEVREGGFDLVHVDEMFLHPVVPPSCPLPLVIHHHKLDVEFARETGTHAYDLAKLRRLESTACARTPHHVLCTAQDAERLASRRQGLRCRVVPNGVDCQRFRPTGEPRTPGRLLFLGSLDYGPNVEALGRLVGTILPRIRSVRPDAHLVIVGARGGAEAAAAAAAGRAARATEGVELVGEVEDVRPHLASAAMLVVPLGIGGGSRLKIVEALGMECPVVTTGVGVEGLELVDGVHLRVADGARAVGGGRAFADAVLELLDDPRRAQELARAGRGRVVERYDWKDLGGSLVEAWEGAVRKVSTP